MNLLAHAQDLHGPETSEFVHIVTRPLISVLIYIVIILLAYYLLKALKMKVTNMLLIFLFFNLAVGLLLISIAPLLSGIAITAGFITAFFTFLSGELK